MRRPGSLFSSVVLACLLCAAPASAGLLPSPPSTPSAGGVTGTVTGAVTTTTGTVTGTVGGTVGGVLTNTGSTVGGTGSTVGGVIDEVLGSDPGDDGSTLPTDTVDDLIDLLLGGGDTGTGTGGGSGSGSGTTSGTTTGTGTAGAGTTGGGSGGAKGGSGGTTNSASSSNGQSGGAADRKAPKLTFKVLGKLAKFARTGTLKVRVTSNEAAIVAFNALLRPGKARRVHGKPMKVSRKLIRTKAQLLVYRKAGKLNATLKLPKKARNALRHAKTVRISMQAWATDVSRNQARRNIKRTLKR